MIPHLFVTFCYLCARILLRLTVKPRYNEQQSSACCSPVTVKCKYVRRNIAITKPRVITNTSSQSPGLLYIEVSLNLEKPTLKTHCALRSLAAIFRETRTLRKNILFWNFRSFILIVLAYRYLCFKLCSDNNNFND